MRPSLYGTATCDEPAPIKSLHFIKSELTWPAPRDTLGYRGCIISKIAAPSVRITSFSCSYLSNTLPTRTYAASSNPLCLRPSAWRRTPNSCRAVKACATISWWSSCFLIFSMRTLTVSCSTKWLRSSRAASAARAWKVSIACIDSSSSSSSATRRFSNSATFSEDTIILLKAGLLATSLTSAFIAMAMAWSSGSSSAPSLLTSRACSKSCICSSVRLCGSWRARLAM
mmetsp:Transcript_43099/g.63180  ORF Transcript_43099/g.63180 Transcript_43099/m.63180 type:complete len:228 (-) Transcript_43099:660-1343(-)